MKGKWSRRLVLWTLMGFTLNLMAVSAWAATGKVGYFDLQVILDQSQAGKQAKQEFTAEKDRMKATMDQKANAFKQAKEEYDRKKGVMDESAKKKKDKELADLQQEAERALMEANTKLNKLSSDLMAPIVDRIIEIAKKIGKDDKYDYILEAGKGGIVYANEKEDLSKKIIEALDKSPIPARKP
ncbi:MAG TPA: OmpH family outer membrane protein [Syntrophobacteraceae bacterium]|nr:OmpH family outer membrane protein [Syntrophobacteraceae bacterium]